MPSSRLVVSCFFRGTVFVRRQDARREVLCFPRGPLVFLPVSPLVSEHLFFFESPSLGNSAGSVLSGMPSGSSFGQPTSCVFGIEVSKSLGGSVSSVSSVPKSAGIVDEMMLYQQLLTAFQAVFVTRWIILIMTPCPILKKSRWSLLGAIHLPL